MIEEEDARMGGWLFEESKQWHTSKRNNERNVFEQLEYRLKYIFEFIQV